MNKAGKSEVVHIDSHSLQYQRHSHNTQYRQLMKDVKCEFKVLSGIDSESENESIVSQSDSDSLDGNESGLDSLENDEQKESEEMSEILTHSSAQSTCTEEIRDPNHQNRDVNAYNSQQRNAMYGDRSTYLPTLIDFTTPHWNSKPIPPNTEQGRVDLANRVQLKLDAMMELTVYMIDPRWQSILTMASSNLYNAQKTTWMLMKNLETEKMKQNLALRQQLMSEKQSQMHLSDSLMASQKQSQKNKNENNTNKSLHPITDISEHRMVNELSLGGGHGESEIKTEILINAKDRSDKSIGQKYASSLSGAEPELDSHGLPILPDKSKYKAVAMEYCQKMGWKRPVEAAQCVGVGYRATVTFGKPGKEKSASGDGLRQKNAIYEAYIKLVPSVIPIHSAIELMIKWVPGYKKQEKVSTATIAQSGQSIMKHPKSVLLEWAQKNSIAPPKTIFSEFADSARNMRIWTAKVTFCGKTIESKGSKKKDAESACFQQLLKHVMNGGITQHK